MTEQHPSSFRLLRNVFDLSFSLAFQTGPARLPPLAALAETLRNTFERRPIAARCASAAQNAVQQNRAQQNRRTPVWRGRHLEISGQTLQTLLPMSHHPRRQHLRQPLPSPSLRLQVRGLRSKRRRLQPISLRYKRHQSGPRPRLHPKRPPLQDGQNWSPGRISGNSHARRRPRAQCTE